MKKTDIRMPEALFDAVDEAVASGEYRSRSDVLRSALVEYLNADDTVQVPVSMTLERLQSFDEVKYIKAREIAAGTDLSNRQAGRALGKNADDENVDVDVEVYSRTATGARWRVDPSGGDA